MTNDFLARWLILGIALSLPLTVWYCNGTKVSIIVGLTALAIEGACALAGVVVQRRHDL